MPQDEPAGNSTQESSHAATEGRTAVHTASLQGAVPGCDGVAAGRALVLVSSSSAGERSSKENALHETTTPSSTVATDDGVEEAQSNRWSSLRDGSASDDGEAATAVQFGADGDAEVPRCRICLECASRPTSHRASVVDLFMLGRSSKPCTVCVSSDHVFSH